MNYSKILFLVVLVINSCSINKNRNRFSENKNHSLDENVKDKFCFIFIDDEKSTYDKNFYDAAIDVCEELNVEPIIKTNIGEDEICYNTAKELAQAGCKGIFANSFGHESNLIRAAKEFKNIEFGHATGNQAHKEKLDNFHNAFASIYEGRYVTGIAAGMKLNEMIEKGEIKKSEAKVGYIGAFPYAEVISGYSAFYLGIKSVCDSATMIVRYSNSWYDEEGEKNLAEKLIDEDKCKIISQHADSQGAPSVCESRGIPNVFYNGENKSNKKSYLISSRINWRPYFRYFINNTLNGKKMGYDWTGNLQDGAVEIYDASDIAAKGTQDAINKAIEDLKEKKLKVFDTSKFTVNGKPVTSYKIEGDKELISDGYFHESEYISAPSFDLKIDGITVITDDEKDTSETDTSTDSTSDIIVPNSTNYTIYRRHKDSGLSAGAICAIIIPLCVALLAATILAFICKSGTSGPSTIANTPMPNQNVVDSQYNFPIKTQT